MTVPAFEQGLSGRIAHGPGRLAALGTDVAALAGPAVPVLLVADPGVARAGLADRATAALTGAGHAVTLFTELQGDPLAAQIDAAAALARRTGARAVVGLGGGSALDVAKLAAGIAPAEAPSEHYALCANPLPEVPLPLVAIPTTAGTGSEVTRTSVFTTAAGDKVWAWGETLRPALALLDPTLTTGLPRSLTIATGLDALVHAIEATTSRRANPLGDAYAREAIRLVMAHLPAAADRPDDLEARAGLLVAACLAGLAIDACGTAVAHALGHALGAVGHVHHGRAVALCLRVALPGNAAAAPDRHAAVARAMGIGHADTDDAALAAALPAAYDGFLRRVGLAISLAGDGLGPADRDRLARAALRPENAPMREANCRPLDTGAVDALFAALLEAR